MTRGDGPKGGRIRGRGYKKNLKDWRKEVEGESDPKV